MARHEVDDGMWTVDFDAEIVASTRTEKDWEPGLTWEKMPDREKNMYLRWTEMTLYRVPAGQVCLNIHGEDLLRLGDGGYLFHVVGQSVCYHRHDYCNAGIKTAARDTSIDVLPCPKCRPPMIWSWRPGQRDDTAVMLVEPDLIVDLESPFPKLHRADTARGIVREIEGHKVSLPAKRILEIAKQNDPAIAAVFARPAPPQSSDAA